MSPKRKTRIRFGISFSSMGLPLSYLYITGVTTATFKGVRKERLSSVWIRISFLCFYMYIDMYGLKSKWVSVKRSAE